MTRVYIAGPMRGRPHFNFPAFYAAEEALREAGHDPVNPARLDVDNGDIPADWEARDFLGDDDELDWIGFDLPKAMKRDIAYILGCDAVYMLEGWEHSTGATQEKAIAEACSLDVWYEVSQGGTRVIPNPAVSSLAGGYFVDDSSIQDVVDRMSNAENEEVRSVDPDTGAEKGTKPDRYDLIPVGPLRELARHYGVGATKYTKTELVSWDTFTNLLLDRARRAAALSVDELPFVAAAVEAVTNSHCGAATRSSPTVSAETDESGGGATGNTSPSGTESTGSRGTSRTTSPCEPVNAPSRSGDWDSGTKSDCSSSKGECVRSAEGRLGNDGSTSTTTTPQDSSVACCVGSATRDLDSWETISKGWSELSRICDAPVSSSIKRQGDGVVITTTGARNWERGYVWSNSFAAMQRHLWAWWGGEDLDPETGSNHLVAAAWHCFTLLEFTTTHPEKDDRP